MYAAGCRTGHRGAATLVADDLELAEEWARAYPPAAGGAGRSGGHLIGIRAASSAESLEVAHEATSCHFLPVAAL